MPARAARLRWAHCRFPSILARFGFGEAMPPSPPRGSRHSRASACDSPESRKPTSTSAGFLRARRELGRCAGNKAPLGRPRPSARQLTFDDGPWPKNTLVVLAALAAHCTKAIFFPIGLHATYEPSILKEVAAAGHAVGSHDSGALATPAGPRQPPRRPDRCTPLAQASVPVRSR